MRRCQEDLAPSPAHPGCIYGEMAMCLRPCQEVVGAAEYASEIGARRRIPAHRRALAAGIDRALARPAEPGDDVRGSGAPAQALEKVQDVLRLRDELARDIDRLNGVAITPSLAPDAVELWFVRDGYWCAPQRFGFEVREGKPVSLDHQLRETFAAVDAAETHGAGAPGVSGAAGALVLLDLAGRRMAALRILREIPYRKLVNAVSRVANARAGK